AGAQAETAVVPRASHRLADDDPVGERALVVCARRANSKDLVVHSGHEHGVVADMSEDLVLGVEAAYRYAGAEIRPGRRFLFAHKAPCGVWADGGARSGRASPDGGRRSDFPQCFEE